MKNIDEITDKLGLPIDNNIKYAVKCFNDAGFETCASCEGHFHAWGLPHPWIHFNEWGHYRKLSSLIDEFYLTKDKPDYYIRIIKYANFYSVQTSPYLKGEIESFVRDIDLLEKSRKEMDDFATFLLRNK